MLECLKVKNFAIIEDIQIQFKKGMTVLTGETGAGKSLIIDTISLLLGQRADNDMIRYGESKAIIEGIFSDFYPTINDILEKFGISKQEKLTITREIMDSGRNNIRLNGTSITLAMLKQVAPLLADIHVQNDTYRLFTPEHYLTMITPIQDPVFDALQTKYTLCLAKYLDYYRNYEHILKGQKESVTRLEFLEYEKAELLNLNLEKGMDERLKNEISKLENFDKIYTNLALAYSSLEGEFEPLDHLYESANALKKIEGLDNKYKEYSSQILDSYYLLEEIKGNISKELESFDFDQDELNLKIEQYQEIEKVKAKYKMSIEELISYLEKITLDLEIVQNYDEILKTTYKDLEQSFYTLKDQAIQLYEYRKKIALQLEKKIIEECQQLDLEDIQFKIELKLPNEFHPLHPEVFQETGADSIDFLISFNPGEPLHSLHKVASGGEMSRMMLAFKSYFANRSPHILMIFDEIDTGVSGGTAKKIAKKMAKISKSNQVLCITHLPQVASIGDEHIHIYKELIRGRTTTHFKYLGFDERVEEVALMLSGDKMSLFALEHAKALLKEKYEEEKG